MFGAVRRCAARVPQSLCRPAYCFNAASRNVARTTSPLNDRLLFVSARHFHFSTGLQQQAATSYVKDSVDSDFDSRNPDQAKPDAPITKFAELQTRRLIDTAIIDNITNRMGLETMTEVQSATINESLKGADIIARAKTGTGKTIAFLLPILQKIVQEDPGLAGRVSQKKRTTAEDVRAIIISPTRELAEQIAQEARRLTENTKIIVQCAVGGTQKREMLQKTRREGCHVLVATPGRLKDILSDDYSGVKAPYLDMLVMDEADRLLDQGFWPEVESIIQDYLPPTSEKDRQTMMFSATMPKEVIHIVRQTLKRDYQYVDCVGQDDVPTHERVQQKVVQAFNLENQLPTLFELCQREVEKAENGEGRPFKAIVFFNSTAHTTLASSVFQNVRHSDPRHPLYPANIIEIHSRLSQQRRTRAADSFRRAKSAILFSSDVTARGMDFPDVTHVIQIGLPAHRDTYVHRIGRTARAGKEGVGWLILSSMEATEAGRRLNGLPLEEDDSLSTATVDMSKPAQLSARTAQILKDISEAHKTIDVQDLSNAYRAFIGIFQWYPKKQKLVDLMNRMTRFGWAMSTPPAVSATLAQRLGLRDTVGLNLSHGFEQRDSGRRGFAGGRNDEFEDDGGSFGGRSRSFGDRGRSFGDRNSSFGNRGRSFGDRNRSFGDRRSSYGDRRDSFGGRRSSFGDQGGDRRRSFDGGRSRGSFGDRRD